MKRVILSGISPPSILDTLIHVNRSSFNFPVLIERLKNDQTQNDKLKSSILLKSPEKQIVLAAMHKGTEISSFQNKKYITFKVMEGSLKFQSYHASATLDMGHLLELQENVKYRLISLEDSVLLITITNNILHASQN